MPPDPDWPGEAVQAAAEYLRVARDLGDRSYWPLVMHCSTNLFLWHLEAFASSEDPIPLFVREFEKAADFLRQAKASGVCGGHFTGTGAEPTHSAAKAAGTEFEDEVSGLFSDLWLGMTDEIYFEQPHQFTKERLTKSGVDPDALFGGKVVVDAGCGGGKFSAAIARFGADKVIGVDLGQKGLGFAVRQARRSAHWDRLAYCRGSVLEIPLRDDSVDVVWSNGVIHHTLGYVRALQEFARVLRSGGFLFLYVNGRFGLWELLLDTLRRATEPVPRALFQHFLHLLGINSGRIYWMMDCLYAPYEWKSSSEVLALLEAHGFVEPYQLVRGVATDQIEQISTGLAHARVKYGEGQLKYLTRKA